MPITPEQKLVVQFYESFGTKVKGFITDIVDGPVVSNFFYRVDSGASIPKKLSLDKGITFHNFEHNDFVVHIPKETRQTIFFDKLVKSDAFKNTQFTLPLIMGVGTYGDPMILNLQSMPHMLVTGHTGCGKSVFIMGLIKSLMTKLSPTECKFVIFDPRAVDFVCLDGDKHLLRDVVVNPEEGLKVFENITQMIDERYQKLADNNVRNIIEYKEKTNKKDMPFIIVVIDEFVDFMYIGKKQTERFISTVAQKARATGIHLILGTQRPDKEVLTNTIKATMPVRVAFQARSAADSINMFGERGAEQLLPFGDMLISEAGRKPVRIHTPYVTIK